MDDELDADPSMDGVADAIATLPDDVLAYERDDDDPPEAQESDPDDDDAQDDDAEEDGEGDEGGGDEDDPLVEIAAQDGQKVEVRLSQLVEAHGQMQALKGRAEEVIQRVETQAREQRQSALRDYGQRLSQASQQVTAFLAALPQPQPPNAAMLDPSSQAYNPDRYHMERAQFEQLQAYRAHVGQQMQHLNQERQKAEQAEMGERVEAEFQKLSRVWPQLTQGGKEVAQAVVGLMNKYYGLDEETINSVVDHRFYAMARDALAFRTMKDKAPATRKAIEQKAPKVTRSQGKPVQVKGRDEGGRFVAKQRERLKKTGRVEDAAALFERFL